MNVRTKFEVRSFTRYPFSASEVIRHTRVSRYTNSIINSDCSIGWGLRTPNLEEEEAVGVGDGTVRKSVGEFL